MRRTITLVALALLASAAVPSASAQSMADQVQKEGHSQVARTKKYTHAARSKGYMSSPRSSMNHTAPDATGRVDMSGHAPPSYSRVRDNKSTNFSTRSYNPSTRRPARSNYYSQPARPTNAAPPPPPF